MRIKTHLVNGQRAVTPEWTFIGVYRRPYIRPRLNKIIFDAIENSLFVRLVFHRERFAKLLEQLLLLACELDRHFDVDVDEEVAASAGL